MLLIVGLGNPGADYARHRHNVGFMAVDAIHRRHGFGPWRRRFRAELSEGTLAGVKTLLVKPQTYMNESGGAVGEAAGFYRIGPSDILVIHDEVDLPPGKIRMKAGGGSGGHNGLRSISAAVGDGYRRLRIGVGHPGQPGMVHLHVLRDFAKSDAAWLTPLLAAIADRAPLLAEGKDPTFANRIHESLAPAKPAKENPKPDSGLAEESESKSERRDMAKQPEKPEGPLARGLKRLFGGDT